MYSHIMKGFSVGSTIGRRSLRTITGIPGFLADALIFAPLWDTSEYGDYWKQGEAIYYGDEERVGGIAQGVTGWIGETIGYVVGGAIGTIVGAVSFIPDGILRLACYAHDQAAEKIESFAELVGEREFFEPLNVYSSPDTFAKKSWNIFAATAGLAIAALPFIAAKAVEFILPIGNTLSTLSLGIGGTIGGMVGAIASGPLYLAAHVTKRLSEGYQNFRDKVRGATAMFYAKADIKPEVSSGGGLTNNDAMHSPEFRERVRIFKTVSTTEWLFGKIREQNQAAEPAYQPAGPLTDPLSLKQFEDPVIAPCGHTFSRVGIFQWLDGHSTCPIGRKPLHKSDLIPNLAVAELVSARPA